MGRRLCVRPDRQLPIDFLLSVVSYTGGVVAFWALRRPPPGKNDRSPPSERFQKPAAMTASGPQTPGLIVGYEFS
jgi:hypothetical protein